MLELPPGELVLGAEREGEAKLYPTSALNRHHLVNDRLAGKPFVVAFCGKCFSGIGFDPVVDGRTLEFEVYGAYQGSFVMSDETRTIWSSLTGEALVGPLAGRRLRCEPVHMTTLERWLELYPESLAPDPALMVPAPPLRPGNEPLANFRESVPSWDDRLPERTLVLGVAVERGTRAYVIDPDRPGPRLLEDELAGIPIVLLAPAGVWPLAYDRRLDGRVVSLRLEADGLFDDTGSRWNEEALAIDGLWTGRRLAFVPSFIAEWYAWSASHPRTEIAA